MRPDRKASAARSSATAAAIAAPRPAGTPSACSTPVQTAAAFANSLPNSTASAFALSRSNPCKNEGKCGISAKTLAAAGKTAIAGTSAADFISASADGVIAEKRGEEAAAHLRLAVRLLKEAEQLQQHQLLLGCGSNSSGVSPSPAALPIEEKALHQLAEPQGGTAVQRLEEETLLRVACLCGAAVRHLTACGLPGVYGSSTSCAKDQRQHSQVWHPLPPRESAKGCALGFKSLVMLAEVMRQLGKEKEAAACFTESFHWIGELIGLEQRAAALYSAAAAMMDLRSRLERERSQRKLSGRAAALTAGAQTALAPSDCRNRTALGGGAPSASGVVGESVAAAQQTASGGRGKKKKAVMGLASLSAAETAAGAPAAAQVQEENGQTSMLKENVTGVVGNAFTAKAAAHQVPAKPEEKIFTAGTSNNTSTASTTCRRLQLASVLSPPQRPFLSPSETDMLRYCRRALEYVLLLQPEHIAASSRLVKVLLLLGDFAAAAGAVQHAVRLLQQTPSRKVLWLTRLLRQQQQPFALSLASSLLAATSAPTVQKEDSKNKQQHQQALAVASGSTDKVEAATTDARVGTSSFCFSGGEDEAVEQEYELRFALQQQQRLRRQVRDLQREDFKALKEALECRVVRADNTGVNICLYTPTDSMLEKDLQQQQNEDSAAARAATRAHSVMTAKTESEMLSAENGALQLLGFLRNVIFTYFVAASAGQQHIDDSSPFLRAALQKVTVRCSQLPQPLPTELQQQFQQLAESLSVLRNSSGCFATTFSADISRDASSPSPNLHPVVGNKSQPFSSSGTALTTPNTVPGGSAVVGASPSLSAEFVAKTSSGLTTTAASGAAAIAATSTTAAATTAETAATSISATATAAETAADDSAALLVSIKTQKKKIATAAAKKSNFSVPGSTPFFATTAASATAAGGGGLGGNNTEEALQGAVFVVEKPLENSTNSLGIRSKSSDNNNSGVQRKRPTLTARTQQQQRQLWLLQQQQQQQRSRNRLRQEKPRRLKLLHECEGRSGSAPFTLWRAFGLLLRVPHTHMPSCTPFASYEHMDALEQLWGDAAALTQLKSSGLSYKILLANAQAAAAALVIGNVVSNNTNSQQQQANAAAAAGTAGATSSSIKQSSSNSSSSLLSTASARSSSRSISSKRGIHVVPVVVGSATLSPSTAKRQQKVAASLTNTINSTSSSSISGIEDNSNFLCGQLQSEGDLSSVDCAEVTAPSSSSSSLQQSLEPSAVNIDEQTQPPNTAAAEEETAVTAAAAVFGGKESPDKDSTKAFCKRKSGAATTTSSSSSKCSSTSNNNTRNCKARKGNTSSGRSSSNGTGSGNNSSTNAAFFVANTSTPSVFATTTTTTVAGGAAAGGCGSKASGNNSLMRTSASTAAAREALQGVIAAATGVAGAAAGPPSLQWILWQLQSAMENAATCCCSGNVTLMGEGEGSERSFSSNNSDNSSNESSTDHSRSSIVSECEKDFSYEDVADHQRMQHQQQQRVQLQQQQRFSQHSQFLLVKAIQAALSAEDTAAAAEVAVNAHHQKSGAKFVARESELPTLSLLDVLVRVVIALVMNRSLWQVLAYGCCKNCSAVGVANETSSRSERQWKTTKRSLLQQSSADSVATFSSTMYNNGTSCCNYCLRSSAQQRAAIAFSSMISSFLALSTWCIAAGASAVAAECLRFSVAAGRLKKGLILKLEQPERSLQQQQQPVQKSNCLGSNSNSSTSHVSSGLFLLEEEWQALLQVVVARKSAATIGAEGNDAAADSLALKNPMLNQSAQAVYTWYTGEVSICLSSCSSRDDELTSSRISGGISSTTLGNERSTRSSSAVTVKGPLLYEVALCLLSAAALGSAYARLPVVPSSSKNMISRTTTTALDAAEAAAIFDPFTVQALQLPHLQELLDAAGSCLYSGALYSQKRCLSPKAETEPDISAALTKEAAAGAMLQKLLAWQALLQRQAAAALAAASAVEKTGDGTFLLRSELPADDGEGAAAALAAASLLLLLVPLSGVENQQHFSGDDCESNTPHAAAAEAVNAVAVFWGPPAELLQSKAVAAAVAEGMDLEQIAAHCCSNSSNLSTAKQELLQRSRLKLEKHTPAASSEGTSPTASAAPAPPPPETPVGSLLSSTTGAADAVNNATTAAPVLPVVAASVVDSSGLLAAVADSSRLSAVSPSTVHSAASLADAGDGSGKSPVVGEASSATTAAASRGTAAVDKSVATTAESEEDAALLELVEGGRGQPSAAARKEAAHVRGAIVAALVSTSREAEIQLIALTQRVQERAQQLAAEETAAAATAAASATAGVAAAGCAGTNTAGGGMSTTSSSSSPLLSVASSRHHTHYASSGLLPQVLGEGRGGVAVAGVREGQQHQTFSADLQADLLYFFQATIPFLSRVTRQISVLTAAGALVLSPTTTATAGSGVVSPSTPVVGAATATDETSSPTTTTALAAFNTLRSASSSTVNNNTTTTGLNNKAPSNCRSECSPLLSSKATPTESSCVFPSGKKAALLTTPPPPPSGGRKLGYELPQLVELHPVLERLFLRLTSLYGDLLSLFALRTVRTLDAPLLPCLAAAIDPHFDMQHIRRQRYGVEQDFLIAVVASLPVFLSSLLAFRRFSIGASPTEASPEQISIASACAGSTSNTNTTTNCSTTNTNIRTSSLTTAGSSTSSTFSAGSSTSNTTTTNSNTITTMNSSTLDTNISSTSSSNTTSAGNNSSSSADSSGEGGGSSAALSENASHHTTATDRPVVLLSSRPAEGALKEETFVSTEDEGLSRKEEQTQQYQEQQHNERKSNASNECMQTRLDATAAASAAANEAQTVSSKTGACLLKGGWGRASAVRRRVDDVGNGLKGYAAAQQILPTLDTPFCMWGVAVPASAGVAAWLHRQQKQQHLAGGLEDSDEDGCVYFNNSCSTVWQLDNNSSGSTSADGGVSAVMAATTDTDSVVEKCSSSKLCTAAEEGSPEKSPLFSVGNGENKQRNTETSLIWASGGGANLSPPSSSSSCESMTTSEKSCSSSGENARGFCPSSSSSIRSSRIRAPATATTSSSSRRLWKRDLEISSSIHSLQQLEQDGCYLHSSAVRLSLAIGAFALPEIAAVAAVCCCCNAAVEKKRFASLPAAAGTAAVTAGGGAGGAGAAASAAVGIAAVVKRRGAAWKDFCLSGQLARWCMHALLLLAAAPLEAVATTTTTIQQLQQKKQKNSNSPTTKPSTCSSSDQAEEEEEEEAAALRSVERLLAWQLHPLTSVLPAYEEDDSSTLSSKSGDGNCSTEDSGAAFQVSESGTPVTTAMSETESPKKPTLASSPTTTPLLLSGLSLKQGTENAGGAVAAALADSEMSISENGKASAVAEKEAQPPQFRAAPVAIQEDATTTRSSNEKISGNCSSTKTWRHHYQQQQQQHLEQQQQNHWAEVGWCPQLLDKLEVLGRNEERGVLDGGEYAARLAQLVWAAIEVEVIVRELEDGTSLTQLDSCLPQLLHVAPSPTAATPTHTGAADRGGCFDSGPAAATSVGGVSTSMADKARAAAAAAANEREAAAAAAWPAALPRWLRSAYWAEQELPWERPVAFESSTGSSTGTAFFSRAAEVSTTTQQQPAQQRKKGVAPSPARAATSRTVPSSVAAMDNTWKESTSNNTLLTRQPAGLELFPAAGLCSPSLPLAALQISLRSIRTCWIRGFEEEMLICAAAAAAADIDRHRRNNILLKNSSSGVEGMSVDADAAAAAAAEALENCSAFFDHSQGAAATAAGGSSRSATETVADAPERVAVVTALKVAGAKLAPFATVCGSNAFLTLPLASRMLQLQRAATLVSSRTIATSTAVANASARFFHPFLLQPSSSPFGSFSSSSREGSNGRHFVGDMCSSDFSAKKEKEAVETESESVSQVLDYCFAASEIEDRLGDVAHAVACCFYFVYGQPVLPRPPPSLDRLVLKTTKEQQRSNFLELSLPSAMLGVYIHRAVQKCAPWITEAPRREKRLSTSTFLFPSRETREFSRSAVAAADALIFNSRTAPEASLLARPPPFLHIAATAPTPVVLPYPLGQPFSLFWAYMSDSLVLPSYLLLFLVLSVQVQQLQQQAYFPSLVPVFPLAATTSSSSSSSGTTSTGIAVAEVAQKEAQQPAAAAALLLLPFPSLRSVCHLSGVDWRTIRRRRSSSGSSPRLLPNGGVNCGGSGGATAGLWTRERASGPGLVVANIFGHTSAEHSNNSTCAQSAAAIACNALCASLSPGCCTTSGVDQTTTTTMACVSPIFPVEREQRSTTPTAATKTVVAAETVFTGAVMTPLSLQQPFITQVREQLLLQAAQFEGAKGFVGVSRSTSLVEWWPLLSLTPHNQRLSRLLQQQLLTLLHLLPAAQHQQLLQKSFLSDPAAASAALAALPAAFFLDKNRPLLLVAQRCVFQLGSSCCSVPIIKKSSNSSSRVAVRLPELLSMSRLFAESALQTLGSRPLHASPPSLQGFSLYMLQLLLQAQRSATTEAEALERLGFAARACTFCAANPTLWAAVATVLLELLLLLIDRHTVAADALPLRRAALCKNNAAVDTTSSGAGAAICMPAGGAICMPAGGANCMPAGGAICMPAGGSLCMPADAAVAAAASVAAVTVDSNNNKRNSSSSGSGGGSKGKGSSSSGVKRGILSAAAGASAASTGGAEKGGGNSSGASNSSSAVVVSAAAGSSAAAASAFHGLLCCSVAERVSAPSDEVLLQLFAHCCLVVNTCAEIWLSAVVHYSHHRPPPRNANTSASKHNGACVIISGCSSTTTPSDELGEMLKKKKVGARAELGAVELPPYWWLHMKRSGKDVEQVSELQWRFLGSRMDMLLLAQLLWKHFRCLAVNRGGDNTHSQGRLPHQQQRGETCYAPAAAQRHARYWQRVAAGDLQALFVKAQLGGARGEEGLALQQLQFLQHMQLQLHHQKSSTQIKSATAATTAKKVVRSEANFFCRNSLSSSSSTATTVEAVETIESFIEVTSGLLQFVYNERALPLAVETFRNFSSSEDEPLAKSQTTPSTTAPSVEKNNTHDFLRGKASEAHSPNFIRGTVLHHQHLLPQQQQLHEQQLWNWYASADMERCKTWVEAETFLWPLAWLRSKWLARLAIWGLRIHEAGETDANLQSIHQLEQLQQQQQQQFSGQQQQLQNDEQTEPNSRNAQLHGVAVSTAAAARAVGMRVALASRIAQAEMKKQKQQQQQQQQSMGIAAASRDVPTEKVDTCLTRECGEQQKTEDAASNGGVCVQDEEYMSSSLFAAALCDAADALLLSCIQAFGAEAIICPSNDARDTEEQQLQHDILHQQRRGSCSYSKRRKGANSVQLIAQARQQQQKLVTSLSESSSTGEVQRGVSDRIDVSNTEDAPHPQQQQRRFESCRRSLALYYENQQDMEELVEADGDILPLAMPLYYLHALRLKIVLLSQGALWRLAALFPWKVREQQRPLKQSQKHVCPTNDKNSSPGGATAAASAKDPGEQTTARISASERSHFSMDTLICLDHLLQQWLAGERETFALKERQRFLRIGAAALCVSATEVMSSLPSEAGANVDDTVYIAESAAAVASASNSIEEKELAALWPFACAADVVADCVEALQYLATKSRQAGLWTSVPRMLLLQLSTAAGLPSYAMRHLKQLFARGSCKLLPPDAWLSSHYQALKHRRMTFEKSKLRLFHATAAAVQLLANTVLLRTSSEKQKQLLRIEQQQNQELQAVDEHGAQPQQHQEEQQLLLKEDQKGEHVQLKKQDRQLKSEPAAVVAGDGWIFGGLEKIELLDELFQGLRLLVEQLEAQMKTLRRTQLLQLLQQQLEAGIPQQQLLQVQKLLAGHALGTAAASWVVEDDPAQQTSLGTQTEVVRVLLQATTGIFEELVGQCPDVLDMSEMHKAITQLFPDVGVPSIDPQNTYEAATASIDGRLLRLLKDVVVFCKSIQLPESLVQLLQGIQCQQQKCDDGSKQQQEQVLQQQNTTHLASVNSVGAPDKHFIPGGEERIFEELQQRLEQAFVTACRKLLYYNPPCTETGGRAAAAAAESGLSERLPASGEGVAVVMKLSLGLPVRCGMEVQEIERMKEALTAYARATRTGAPSIEAFLRGGTSSNSKTAVAARGAAADSSSGRTDAVRAKDKCGKGTSRRAAGRGALGEAETSEVAPLQSSSGSSTGERVQRAALQQFGNDVPLRCANGAAVEDDISAREAADRLKRSLESNNFDATDAKKRRGGKEELVVDAVNSNEIQLLRSEIRPCTQSAN